MVADRPNILFIQTDQQTIDVLNAYGNPICKTPYIDELAKNGVVFENAYCNYPLCSPSRMSMATGRLASKVGAYDNASEFPASLPTYAHYMRKLGYRTTLSGKMHFVGPDQRHGFEHRLTSDLYPGNFEWAPDWSATGFHGATDTSVLTDAGICARNVQLDYDDDVTHKAVQEIYDCARQKHAKPFFLHVSYTHPHDPYLCPQDYWDRYDDVDIPAPKVGMIDEADNDPHSIRVLKQHGFLNADISDNDIAKARRAYCGSVSYTDDQIGKLIHALKESGQWDNTVIVYTSDHGEMLGERGLWLKKTMWEASVRVPLIMHYPQKFKPSRVSTFCSLVDLLPTYTNLGAEGDWLDAVDDLDGEDLTTFIGASHQERTIYSELLCEGILAPIFMIRRDKYKFITSDGDPDLLFDLENDPQEMKNLIDDPDHQELVAEYKKHAQEKWDNDVLVKDITKTQQRRKLINQAHQHGNAPYWDYPHDEQHNDRWYRGQMNYNSWAMDYLPKDG